MPRERRAGSKEVSNLMESVSTEVDAATTRGVAGKTVRLGKRRLGGFAVGMKDGFELLTRQNSEPNFMVVHFADSRQPRIPGLLTGRIKDCVDPGTGPSPPGQRPLHRRAPRPQPLQALLDVTEAAFVELTEVEPLDGGRVLRRESVELAQASERWRHGPPPSALVSSLTVGRRALLQPVLRPAFHLRRPQEALLDPPGQPQRRAEVRDPEVLGLGEAGKALDELIDGDRSPEGDRAER